MREPAKRRREKDVSVRRTTLYETWRQLTFRATIFEQKYRLHNSSTHADVKKWYNNEKAFTTGHNTTDNDTTRNLHMGVKQLLEKLETLLTVFSDKKTPTDGRT